MLKSLLHHMRCTYTSCWVFDECDAKAPDYGDVNAVVNDRNPLWFFVFLEPEFKDDNHTIKFGSSLPSWLEKLQLSHV